MAGQEQETNINVQLFKELTEKYPDVPTDFVSLQLRKTGNNRDEVIKVLKERSQQNLFGSSNTVDIKPGTVINQINNLTISKRKENKSPMLVNQRSDGVSYPTLAWPTTGNTTMTSSPQPGYSAPVMPNDLETYIERANSQPGLIPNINCTVDNSSHSVSQTVKKFEVNNVYGNKTSPVVGKRPVPVIHVPSKPVNSVQSVNTSYQIHSAGGGTNTVTQPQHSHTYSYNITPTVQYNSAQSPNTPSQFASKTKIMINQPPSNSLDSPTRPNNLRPQLGYGDLQNKLVQPSDIDGNIGHMRSSPNLTNYSKPLFVKIKSTGPEGSETQVRYNFNRDNQSMFANPNTNRQIHQPTFSGGSRIQISQLNQSPGNSSPNMTTYVQLPPYGGRPFSASSRTNSEDSDHGTSNAYLCTGDINQPGIYHPMSPASSHSSLSSESSVHLVQGLSKPVSGNGTEDQDYLKALLHHQNTRLDNLKSDYNKTLKETSKLRQEVAQMEANMVENSRRNSFPTINDVTKLREINRRLQTDIQCMGNEIDMKKNGPGMNSLVDPVDQQNFFDNMPTGPAGSIGRPSSTSSPSSSVPPPLPPISAISSVSRRVIPPPMSPLDVVPPVPPRQPQSGSGDSEEGEQWNCTACTFLNHPALNKCECCEMPRIGPS